MFFYKNTTTTDCYDTISLKYTVLLKKDTILYLTKCTITRKNVANSKVMGNKLLSKLCSTSPLID